jgi:hypothetical protein
MGDTRWAKLVNFCQRRLEHYWDAGDRVNVNLVSVWLDELTNEGRFYRIKVAADPNPFPKIRFVRWLP